MQILHHFWLSLQIRTFFAMRCTISYAFDQYELVLLRPPIIFDRLSVPEIDRLTSKPRSSMCL